MQYFFFYQNSECVLKQNKSVKVFCSVTTFRTKRVFFYFLLPWVSEGRKLCHVVYMLTQKEGQVLAIRSLGLMWPGHGHGSSESPVEP